MIIEISNEAKENLKSPFDLSESTEKVFCRIKIISLHERVSPNQ